MPIIDADLIAKELTALNTPSYKKIITHFGLKELDRKLLRNIIFNDPKERLWLEKLLHPLIHKEACKQLAKIHSPLVIIIMPLLFETKVTGIRKMIDRVLVVDIDEKTQIERLKKRDGIDTKAAKLILNAQLNNKSRVEKADDVILNNGSLADLKKQVKTLYSIWSHAEEQGFQILSI